MEKMKLNIQLFGTWGADAAFDKKLYGQVGYSNVTRNGNTITVTWGSRVKSNYGTFNYGMGDKERVQKAIRCGLRYTLYIMLAGFVILEVFATPFSALFDLSGETQSLCISAIRIISLSFVFAGCNIAFQGVFQALDSGLPSLIVSVCRQFLFVLPVAYLLSLPARQNSEMTWLVWLTFPFAELLACIIAYIFMKRINKNKINL